MSVIVIMADESAFPCVIADGDSVVPGGIPAISGVDDGKGRKLTVQAHVADGVATWTLPDNDANRELFQRDYKPSGLFRAKVDNVRAVQPIDGDDSENEALKASLAEREAEMLSLSQQLVAALAENEALKAENAELKAAAPAKKK